ncbi:CU044_5270 family protein, partial [Actinoplanes sp. NPDC051633]|uniref:CU044_5270 family protein n=1 Tax=Actinoplanes sp. NPDC051633 TaxID=3155670 RepID=UPI00341F6EF2
MNEMTRLAELGERLDPPSALPPADLRRRVMATTRVRRNRWTPRLIAAGTLAAVATGVVLAGQVVEVGDRPPAASAQAAEILRGAAARARQQPAVPVRDDQFVYVESIATSASMNASGEGAVTLESRRREIWLSVDGTRDGLLRSRRREGSGDAGTQPIPGCEDGVMSVRKGTRSVEVPCAATPGYRRDLPADPGAMVRYLYRQGGTKNPPDQDAFTAAGDLIREAYLAPAVRSALFEAASRI